jgi:hypothetical protein
VVSPRGVILADRLIEDGESPVYITQSAIDDHGHLVQAVEQARAELKAG